MAKTKSPFQTIRTEGAMLPPDILQRIASLKVDGVRIDDYHLPPGTKIKEAITQSWATVRAHWLAFQEARESLDSDDTGTSITNDRWLLPLFKELDYGRLTTEKSPEIDERVYPIERFYNNTPIHLIGCNLPMDRRTRGARGAATASPHSMVQEFLNRSDDHLWAFVSNGLQLRILRDNISLSRQAFVEFDLEAMMEGEVYSDFALLWLLCHQSRVESDRPEDCWLEKWSQLAREQGTRVLNDLRLGVANAIEALGRGFIGHPRNDQLREKLHTGTLSKDDYYRQLLRIVYRLLFLFVAEDRGLLHPSDASDAACELYDKHYSTSRLREMALRIRGSKHADLWHSLSLVFDALGEPEGSPELGLPPLGTFLWRSRSTPDLIGPTPQSRCPDGQDPVLITNDDLLQAVRALAYVEQDKVQRSVDYRNLGSEELGSVYESLLELHPVMHVEAKSFDLSTAAGNERKTSGSYYTPDSLVQCLLDSALDPVVNARLEEAKKISRKASASASYPDWLAKLPESEQQSLLAAGHSQLAEKALLSLTVCDPACGSGHFLIAAAHRLARHLARVRTGESEPSPEDYQRALRDVIGRCIYGVDMNPMAVELCKVSLWIEAIDPGRPLTFLDHRIQCGNSLFGTMPALMEKGIPDDAFKPIEGDVKDWCNQLKKRNKRERQDRASGQGNLFEPFYKLGNLPAEFSRLANARDDSVSDVISKEQMYTELMERANYLNARLLADTWCAVFAWKKDSTDLGRLCPTERDFRNIENNPHSILPHVKSEVRRLADQYQVFHWHLAFPDVFQLSEEPENKQAGWSRGFDVVLGNPPWEMPEVDDRQFFSGRNSRIADENSAIRRRTLISELEDSDPILLSKWKAHLRQHQSERAFLSTSNRFPFAGSGRLNYYKVFLEAGWNSTDTDGRLGMVIPSGLTTNAYERPLWHHLLGSSSIESIFDFENRKLLFPNVDGRAKFSLLTLGRGHAEFSTGCWLHATSELSDPDRIVTLSLERLKDFSPEDWALPQFRTARDLRVLEQAVDRFGRFADHDSWRYTPRLMFSSSDEVFRTEDLQVVEIGTRTDLNRINTVDHRCLVPVYEGKMVGILDHRQADIYMNPSNPSRKAQERPIPIGEKRDVDRFAVPQHWIDIEAVKTRRFSKSQGEWELVFCDVTSATNERTALAAIVPMSGLTRSLPAVYLRTANARHAAMLVSLMSSLAYDYFARLKVSSNHLTQGILASMPVPPREKITDFAASVLGEEDWFERRGLEMSFTASDLKPFAQDYGYDGSPFLWDEQKRHRTHAEIHAASFLLYGIERRDVEYVLSTFPTMQRRELEQFNEYRTQRLVLTKYDEWSSRQMSEAK